MAMKLLKSGKPIDSALVLFIFGYGNRRHGILSASIEFLADSNHVSKQAIVKSLKRMQKKKLCSFEFLDSGNSVKIKLDNAVRQLCIGKI